MRERTKRCASDRVRLLAALPREREEVRILGRQLLRSGTSVAGPAREASRARSATEFCSKLNGWLHEADENPLWLELMQEDCGIEGPDTNHLLAETGEIISAFATKVARSRNNGRETP